MNRAKAIWLLPILAPAILGLTACNYWQRAEVKKKVRYPEKLIEFKDQVETNAQYDPAALRLTFIDSRGETVKLEQFRGQRHVVLVFTRGFYSQVCPYCTVQVSRLIANYAEFTKRNAEVLVVFPGEKERLPDFLKAVSAPGSTEPPPFPLLLDVDLSVVRGLGIKSELAKPSTFLLDKEGNLRFAYVGTSDSDRPSLKAILEQLDRLALK